MFTAAFLRGGELHWLRRRLPHAREKHEVAQHILMHLKPVENHTRATKDDILGGIAAGMLVFVSGVPPLLPFVFLDGIQAMRLSSVIGLVMLYAIGYRWGSYVGN